MANRFLKWLYPGIGIKRWVVVITLGFVLSNAAAGFGILGYLNTNLEMRVRLFGFALGLFILAGFALVTGVYRLMKSIEGLLQRRGERKTLVEIAYERRYLEHGWRVVCFGGGTGISTLLKGLKTYTANLTAVVSVADDGGSSGRLRQELDMLPPGDIRKCLIALSDDAPLMAELLSYRFDEDEIEGHSMGNLVLTALTRITGDFGEAVRQANQLFSVRGKVLPATLDRIFLVANHPDGTTTIGQKAISQSAKAIATVELKPNPGPAAEDILQAVAEADMVVIGPGSLYTSVIPNLLIGGIPEALRRSEALKVYVANIWATEGETRGYDLKAHLEALERHAGGRVFDYVLVNNGTIPRDKRAALEADGASLIIYRRQDFPDGSTYKFISKDVVDRAAVLRHSPERLARELAEILREYKTW
ncbi:MAG TPA: YvcK family protein [Planctomycetes bacterium]|nr:YvcK family protein [Planctomycetota bacterium]